MDIDFVAERIKYATADSSGLNTIEVFHIFARYASLDFNETSLLLMNTIYFTYILQFVSALANIYSRDIFNN